MNKKQRLEKILNLLNENDFIATRDIVDKLDLPEPTIRKDIKHLEDNFLIDKIHGSIKLRKEEESFSNSLSKNAKIKSNIAKEAIKHVKSGMIVYVDAGSTTFNLFKLLDDYKVTIVTNSAAAIDIAHKLKNEVIFTGGELKRSTNSFIGSNALKSIQAYNLDIAFIGTNGYNNNSFSTPSVEEADVKSIAIKQANKVYILFDKTKAGSYFKYNFADDSIVEKITK